MFATAPDTAPDTDGASLDDLSDRQLQDEVCTQSAHLTVAECRLVLLVAELDRRGRWAGGGFRSCAHWLNWRCGVSLGAAREQVRVGRALVSLPLVQAAFSTGELSYSKVRAITRVANPHLEESLVKLARLATASQIERIVREYRRADPEEGRATLARQAQRFLRTYTDREGMVVIEARLSPEDGAVVLAAIEAARQALADDRGAGEPPADVPAGTSRSEPEDADLADDAVPGGVPAGTPEPHRPVGRQPAPCERPDDRDETTRVDALVTVCQSVLVHGVEPSSTRGPTASVVVHVDDQVLRDPTTEGCSHLEGAGVVSAHTAQRLACDAAVARIRYRPDGSVVPEGRTREIPVRLRRAVLARDRGCRWPGCTQRRFVDVHHVRFVSNGGRTTLANLTSACRFHHRLVHEGGYRLEMSAAGAVRVFAPDGTEIPQVPRATTPSGPGLVAQHHQAGLAIDAGTLAYGGERFDLALTIDALRCRNGRFGSAA